MNQFYVGLKFESFPYRRRQSFDRSIFSTIKPIRVLTRSYKEAGRDWCTKSCPEKSFLPISMEPTDFDVQE